MRGVFAALLKRMDAQRERHSDLEVRKAALECVHLLAGVGEDFGLHEVFPQMLAGLCVEELLEEFEEWECDDGLKKISRDIRATLKHRMKPPREKETETETKEQSESVETESKEETTDEAPAMGVQPMAQRMVG